MTTTKKVIGHNITPSTISITFDDGRPVIVARDNAAFDKIKDKLYKLDYDGIYELCSPAAGILSFLGGRGKIENGQLIIDGQTSAHSLVPTIVKMARDGQDPSHLVKFLTLLNSNPSMNSRDQLWKFIEKNGITIYTGEKVKVTHVIFAPNTAAVPCGSNGVEMDMQGWLVLYKGVEQSGLDCHSKKFMNAPGYQLQMDRGNVDDNINAACSKGFHAGAYEYVKNFGTRKFVVLVNPADVVSVPHDANATKVRTCKYVVLKETDAIKFGTNSPINDVIYDGREDYEVEYLEYEDDPEYEMATIRDVSMEAALAQFKKAYTVFEVISIKLAD